MAWQKASAAGDKIMTVFMLLWEFIDTKEILLECLVGLDSFGNFHHLGSRVNSVDVSVAITLQDLSDLTGTATEVND